MKIEFADERIKEYYNGPGFHVKNEGKPIEVTAATAGDFLNAKHWLDGEFVNVFQVVGMNKKEAKEANVIETYPDGFPHAKELAAKGFSHADAVLLSREQLEDLKLKGVGPKGLDSILKFSKRA